MQVSQDFDQTKALMQQTADERVETVQQLLDQERVNARKLNQDLLRTEAELDQTQGKMAKALGEVRAIKPVPNREIEAFQPDGKLIVVDDYAGIVHINLGSKDRVYRGLTFSIFDKGSLVAKDGTAKAEVEVYELAEEYCKARIVKPDPKNPVALEDVAVNLIWDAKKPKRFVLTGDFDLDKSGTIDLDAAERITSLMEKWGGMVTDDVSVDTDAIVIGKKPTVPPEPTLEDLETDPLARERYDAAKGRLDRYQLVEKQAVDLMIPIYKYDQFLYLIGYTSQITKPGAF
jgi:NAD-dependent DNA ligase